MKADKSDWDMLSLEEAQERSLELRDEFLESRPTSTVTRQRAVREQRLTATDVEANYDSPDRNYSTMDGYAFDAGDEYPLEVVGEVLAGNEPPQISGGEAVRIATGAPLPEGANAVLKVELADVENGSLRGEEVDEWTYTYRKGSNFSEGDVVVEAGTKLRGRHAAILRDTGVDRVETVVPPRGAVIATGDEIASGEIDDLDSEMFDGYLSEWGIESEYLGAVPDDEDEVTGIIEEACAEFDVVFTSGGTSVGKADHVIKALRELGEVHFHAVRIRPGKPVAVATIDGSWVFAIPGKPIGALVSVETVVRPFFDPQPRPTVGCEFASEVDIPREGFTYVIPVNVDDGEAIPLGQRGISDVGIYDDVFNPSVISSASRVSAMDGYVLTKQGLEKGEEVEVKLF